MTHLLNVLFALSSIDGDLWMKLVEAEFEPRFFALAVACPNDAVRANAWDGMKAFYAKVCNALSVATNGHGEQSDSDTETKMEIDLAPKSTQRLAWYLWMTSLNCLKASDQFIPLAAKAFETGANMLR